MTVISSKEFVSHHDKYFEMAMGEQVCIQQDDNMFLLVYQDKNDLNVYDEASVYEEILEPDEDFYSAISGEEFKKRALEMVEKVHYQYFNQ